MKNKKQPSDFSLAAYVVYFKCGGIGSRKYIITIMSIVQGAVFAYLLLHSIEVIKEYQNISLIPSKYIVKMIVAWLLIVFIWHEYVLGVTFYVWFYRLFDSFIPFTIGVAEVSVIYTMNSPDEYWYASLAILSAVVLVATINQHIKAFRNMRNSSIYKKTNKYLLSSEVLFIISLVSMAGSSVFAMKYAQIYATYSIFFVLSPLIIIIIIIIIGVRTRLYTNAYLSAVNAKVN